MRNVTIAVLLFLFLAIPLVVRLVFGQPATTPTQVIRAPEPLQGNDGYLYTEAAPGFFFVKPGSAFTPSELVSIREAWKRCAERERDAYSKTRVHIIALCVTIEVAPLQVRLHQSDP